MKIKVLITCCFIFLLSLLIYPQDSRKPDLENIEYVNKNQLDPPLAFIGKIKGVIINSNGDKIPFARIGIFTENEHRLIAETTADKQGRFKFKNIKEGDYRLIARVPYDFLCPLNMRIRKVNLNKNDPLRKSKIVLNMIPPEIDTCSFGEIK